MNGGPYDFIKREAFLSWLFIKVNLDQVNPQWQSLNIKNEIFSLSGAD